MLNQRRMAGVALWAEPLVGLFVVRLGGSADVLDSLLLATCLSWGNEWVKNKEKRGKGSWVKMKKGTGRILVGHLSVFAMKSHCMYKQLCMCVTASQPCVGRNKAGRGRLNECLCFGAAAAVCVAGTGGWPPPSDPAAHTLMTFNTAIQRAHTHSGNPACFSTPLTKHTLCAHSSILKLSLTSSYPLTP